MSEMAEAHTRYYHAKDLMEDVISSMDRLASSNDAIGLLRMTDREAMTDLKRRLRDRADHIVKVWD